MLRGEVRTYCPPGSPRQPRVVLVASDGINQSTRPWLLAVPIAESDPGDILAVPVTGHGWANAATLTRCYRGWLAEPLGTLDEETLDQLASALRAALDL